MSQRDPARRGFLRGLVSLPLIGGGVTLIGRPTAVAEPVTKHLLAEYASWLSIERQRAADELFGGPSRDWWPLYGPAYEWHRTEFDAAPASSRAAVVLSAIGCDWRTT